ncbi:MAG: phosphatase PAP2 family protein [Spirosoma sp.]|nr:phosphatase PAP2 family protein [Spirosoma sp.]
MSVLIDLLRRNRWFFLPYALTLTVVGTLQLLTTQTQLMRWVNVRNTPIADVFFLYVTYLGDGAFFVIICIILLIYNRRMGILAFASFALSSLVSLFLKTVVFDGSPRPLRFFEHSLSEYHLIEGLDIHSYNSFPSGHTTSAFALFGLLAFLDRRKDRGWVYFLIAALTGYSRVYLFQHFVEDVFVGSLIGTGASMLVYLWLKKVSRAGGP